MNVAKTPVIPVNVAKPRFIPVNIVKTPVIPPAYASPTYISPYVETIQTLPITTRVDIADQESYPINIGQGADLSNRV